MKVTHVRTSDSVALQLRDYYAARMHDALNGFAFVNAVFAFTESKLWDDLKNDGWLDPKISATRHGYREDQVLGLLRYLVTQDMFKERDRFYVTPYGTAVLAQPSVGRLRLYRGGYGELMMRSRELMEGALTYGRDLQRHGKYVALGSSAATSAFFDEVPLSQLERLGVKTIVDLGCGAGEFIVSFLRRSSAHRAVGIDIDPNGIAEARAAVDRAGVGDRARLVVGDCFDLKVLSENCKDVDVFYAYAMEHELLRDGERAVLDHIDGLAKAFPGKAFLLGEPMVNRTRDDGAFYWAHVLSKQGIPLNVPGWTELLNKLSAARLEAIYRPDHEVVAAYFLIRFGAT